MEENKDIVKQIDAGNYTMTRETMINKLKSDLYGRNAKKHSAFYVFILTTEDSQSHIINLRDFGFALYGICKETIRKWASNLVSIGLINHRGDMMYFMTPEFESILKELSTQINEIFNAQWKQN